MEELVKFIGALPWPAAAAFGVTLAIVVWVTRKGITDGFRSSPAHDAPAAQVAAMVVDSTALNRASAALEAHNSVVAEQNALYRDMIRISSEIGDEIGRLREELRIGREIFNRRN